MSSEKEEKKVLSRREALKRIAVVGVGVAASLSYCLAQAQSRCPAGESGCTLDNAVGKIKQRVDEGAKSVLSNSNPSGRVEEVKETVKDCIDCGVDAVKDGMDKVSGEK